MNTHANPHRLKSALAVLLAFVFCHQSLYADQAGTGPVKIFIMAGQSNMQGHGEISPVETPGTLEYIANNDPNGDYQFLVDDNGAWVTRDDVWIRDEDDNGGGLTIGYGARTDLVGPELSFGHALGDLYEEQVLIIKTAWGGKSLGNDFLPPSSGPYPAPVADGDTGYYYQQILTIVNDVTTNIATYFPDYDGGGFEIVGFCWHQGWNDRVDNARSAAYETNMANFINDIRTDLGVPQMPFVIASSALDGWVRYSQVEEAQLAMANTTTYPAFAGNVAAIDCRTTYNGLDFWQLFSESPQNQGFHWNRNAKTYTHIGLAMADAMSLLVAPRCPYRLQASGDASGVTLNWADGTDAATSVQILRNSSEISASASTAPPTFIDTAAEPGLIEYELNFTLSGDPCPPLTITFDAGITELEAFRTQSNVTLNWQNNLGYTAIEVRRNGSLIESALVGTATSYTDTSPPASGNVTYSVVPTNGSATPTETIINLDGLSPGTAYIYESFEDADSSLDQNIAGPGLSGRWGGGVNVIAESMSYGLLPTSGNQAFNNGGNTSVGAILRPELSNAGLLDDGSELWFSFLTNNTTGVNTAVQLVLGTDRASFFGGLEDGGQGIGVNLNQGATPQAATWSPGRSTGSSSGSIASDTTALIVGKITWGATPSDNDTIEIYLPSEALVLPASPVSTRSAVLDQTQFDTLSFGGKNSGAPSVDEIRFAASYNGVIGNDLIMEDNDAPNPDPMTWQSTPSAEGDSSITMTATTASDASGVEYYFTETSGNPGGDDSGWQNSPIYLDTGLNAGTTYAYSVKARDKSLNQNETAISAPLAFATTDPIDGAAPATPSFSNLPTATSTTAVTDPSGVEYYFTETSGNSGGSDSGWQDGLTHIDSGLEPGTTYSYTITSRDKSINQNQSTPSAAESGTTLDSPSGAGGALIYEPFDDGDSTLSGNTPGLGLIGTWASDSASVVGSNINYGILSSTGNSATVGGSYGSVNFGDTLDGLLDNGDTLWFSVAVLTGTDVGTNPDIGFAIGTNQITGRNNLPMGDAGDGGLGLGFTIKNGQIRASSWDSAVVDNSVARQTSGNSGNGISTETTYLVVGELIFGATNTLNIYLPDTDLNLGTAVSSTTVSLDQTLFDTLSFTAKGAGAPHSFDELRVGTNYDAVIGGGSDTFASWIASFPGASADTSFGATQMEMVRVMAWRTSLELTLVRQTQADWSQGQCPTTSSPSLTRSMRLQPLTSPGLIAGPPTSRISTQVLKPMAMAPLSLSAKEQSSKVLSL